VNKLLRHKILILQGKKQFFTNFQQSSCGMALALLKNLPQVQLKALTRLDSPFICIENNNHHAHGKI
jgi:hypothetical protein